MKLNYFVIPLFTVLVAFLGSRLTNLGMSWYQTIKLTSFTPPGYVIGLVWTIIFILSTIAAWLYWNSGLAQNKLWLVAAIFILNGLLNIFWSYLFFYQHWLGWAVVEAALLDLSVIVLMVLIWPVSKMASWLLLPYAAWTAFATYLTYAIWQLNK